jgi:hypothetical protein
MGVGASRRVFVDPVEDLDHQRTPRPPLGPEVHLGVPIGHQLELAQDHPVPVDDLEELVHPVRLHPVAGHGRDRIAHEKVI